MNRRNLNAPIAVLMGAALSTATALSASNQGGTQMNASAPTVILVHGAFADASSWSSVVERLQRAGLKTQAAVNPLRGLTNDGEYIASLAQQVEGPVLLVGHSYGGPVITHAGSKSANAKGLVFIASFGIDRGQTISDSTAAFPPPLLATSLEQRQYPDSKGNVAVELYIQREKFAQVFAADVPAAQLPVLAASQRPVAAAAFTEPLAVEPAWKRLPSWFLVATQDNAINPDAQRAAATRMKATTTEVAASHAVALSQPDRVANLILEAVKAVSKQTTEVVHR
jgi:pimeloyl-ACP methyl ester carboxylesterase